MQDDKSFSEFGVSTRIGELLMSGSLRGAKFREVKATVEILYDRDWHETYQQFREAELERNQALKRWEALKEAPTRAIGADEEC